MFGGFDILMEKKKSCLLLDKKWAAESGINNMKFWTSDKPVNTVTTLF